MHEPNDVGFGLLAFFVLLFIGPTIFVQLLTVYVVGRFRLAGALLLILTSLLANLLLQAILDLFLPYVYGGVWVLVLIWVVSICIPWFALPLDRFRNSA